MAKWLLAVLVITVALLYLLDRTERHVYQVQAVQCVVNPDALGCEKFNTAAGVKPDGQ